MSILQHVLDELEELSEEELTTVVDKALQIKEKTNPPGKNYRYHDIGNHVCG